MQAIADYYYIDKQLKKKQAGQLLPRDAAIRFGGVQTYGKFLLP